MTATNPVTSILAPEHVSTDSIKDYLRHVATGLLNTLPAPGQLSATERHGILARYSAVLEGNFIYWMTGAYIAAKSLEARHIIMENLLEEVADSHPEMLRRFTMAAHASPDASDALAVYPSLSKVRLFVGRLSPAPVAAMMAFFEDFIQRFMPFLEECAVLQGSDVREYTQVHHVCDVGHSEGLFRAVELEMAVAKDPRQPEEYLYEGVHLLRTLIEDILANPATAH